MESFALKKLNDHVFLITEPWYTEHANVYLIVGSTGSLLLDTGLGIFNLYEWLKEHGMAPNYVFITHSHYDHCGGLYHFSSQSIFLTKEQENAIQDTSLWGLHYLDPTDTADQSLQHALQHYNPQFSIVSKEVPSRISLGNIELNTLKTPGHSEDSLMLYEPTRHWLFSGDMIYDGKLYANFPNADVVEWERQLQKISDLDVQTIFPGHNSILTIENKKSL